MSGENPQSDAQATSSGRLKNFLHGQGLASKALRGSALTVLGFGGGQFLRLLSNLVLTRILFPEAFGLMALVYVFLQGLNNFSDVGVTPAIMRSNVVLPHPDGPSSAVNSPSRNTRSVGSTAVKRPNALWIRVSVRSDMGRQDVASIVSQVSLMKVSSSR